MNPVTLRRSQRPHRIADRNTPIECPNCRKYTRVQVVQPIAHPQPVPQQQPMPIAHPQPVLEQQPVPTDHPQPVPLGHIIPRDGHIVMVKPFDCQPFYFAEVQSISADNQTVNLQLFNSSTRKRIRHHLKVWFR